MILDSDTRIGSYETVGLLGAHSQASMTKQ
jgi:hypothetical protein